MPKAVSQEHEFSADVLLKAELEYISQTAFRVQQAIHYTGPACNWGYAVASGILACLTQLPQYKRHLGEQHAS